MRRLHSETGSAPVGPAPRRSHRWRGFVVLAVFVLPCVGLVRCSQRTDDTAELVRGGLKSVLAAADDRLQFLGIPPGAPPAQPANQETASASVNCANNERYAFTTHGNSDGRGPGVSRLKLTSSCLSNPTGAGCFLDVPFTALGAANISYWVNDTAIVRSGTRLIMVGNPGLTDGNPANIIFRTSTTPSNGTCGDASQWSTATLENCAAGAVKTGPTINGVQYGSNVDGSVLEADPFGAHNVYMVGGMGSSCSGGVNLQAVYSLGAQGASSPTFVAYVPAVLDRVEVKTTPDGALVVFGCASTTPRLWAGYPNANGRFVISSGGCPGTPTSDFCDSNSSLKEVSTAGLPACSTASSLNNVNVITRLSSSLSRITDPSVSFEYNYVRMAYLANGGQIQTAYAYLATRGSSFTSGTVAVGQLPLLTSGDAVLRVNFIDPNNEEGTLPFVSQTSMLYWYEGQGSGPSLKMGYSMVTGLSNYTLPKPLNVVNGTSATWIPNFPNNNFAGDFDRGSFYVATNPIVNGTATYNYYAPWTESGAGGSGGSGGANGYVHYNVVTATEPVYTWSQVSSGIAMGADPGAARLATTSGVTQIHVVSPDSTGAIKRIVYSDNTQTWSGWSALGTSGVTMLPMAAVSWGAGRLDVVAIGGDKNMYQFAEQNGSTTTNWTSIASAGGGFVEAPSITSNASGSLFIVGVAADTGVYFKTWNMSVTNGWSSWARLASGNAKGGLAALSRASNRIDVYARGLDNNLWIYSATTDGASGWEGRGTWNSQASVVKGGLTGSISGVVRDPANAVIDLFSTDGNHPFISGHSDTSGVPQVMHLWLSGSWSQWHTIGGLTASDGGNSPFRSTAAASLSSTRVRVFARGLDNALWWGTSGN
jgi:hypothetical protein